MQSRWMTSLMRGLRPDWMTTGWRGSTVKLMSRNVFWGSPYQPRNAYSNGSAEVFGTGQICALRAVATDGSAEGYGTGSTSALRAVAGASSIEGYGTGYPSALRFVSGTSSVEGYGTGSSTALRFIGADSSIEGYGTGSPTALRFIGVDSSIEVYGDGRPSALRAVVGVGSVEVYGDGHPSALRFMAGASSVEGYGSGSPSALRFVSGTSSVEGYGSGIPSIGFHGTYEYQILALTSGGDTDTSISADDTSTTLEVLSPMSTQLTKGDTSPILYVKLKGPKGATVDLSTATRAEMLWRTNDGVEHVGVCFIEDASAGKISYRWVSGDTNTVGDFPAKFRVTYANGRVESYPNGEPHWIHIIAAV